MAAVLQSGMPPIAVKKLESSGIGPSAAKSLGITVDTANRWSPQFHPVLALRLPYHDIDGSESGFYRVRYLDTLPGFVGQVAKPQRYVQEKDSLNWVYLPRVPTIDWAKIAADATEPLIITEGELKAACACLHGYTTIALGGVTVWRSAKKGVPLLPPLDRFSWKGRQVVVVFDSDAATNPNVAQAQIALCKELQRLGAAPRVASLPAAHDLSKQGLDDFLVSGQDLTPILAETRGLDLGEYLAKFNEEYGFLRATNEIIHTKSSRRILVRDFVGSLHANVRVVEWIQNGNNNPKRTESVVPLEWMRWVARRDFNERVFEPGKPKVTEKGDYNGWKGWGCSPIPGPINAWNAMLDQVFGDSTCLVPERGEVLSKVWFEQWLAYPLQHPGTKLLQGALIWSPIQGVGKSLIGETVGKIYGDHFTTVTNSEMTNDFNFWAEDKQFILGEEITGTNKRGEADKVKLLITRPRITINFKKLAQYVVPDTTNWMITSNHLDAVYLDPNDRRWFVHCISTPKMPAEFYQEFISWRDNGGLEHLFDHLLRVDVSNFDPCANAPSTDHKDEMVQMARGDLEQWIYDLKDDIEAYRKKLKERFYLAELPELVISAQVKDLYDEERPEQSRSVSVNGMSRMLRKVFGPAVRAQGTHYRVGSVNLYPAMNAERWLTASPQELRDYVDKVYVPTTKKKGKF